MINLKQKWLVSTLIVLWITISCCALLGMYALWWGRERVDYFQKDVSVQRSIIFRKAGFSQALLDVIPEIQHNWPENITYAKTGDLNKLSYVAYLLLPRIPSAYQSTPYVVSDDASYSPGKGKAIRPDQALSVDTSHNLLGWLLSFFSVLGISFGIKKSVGNSALSIPECFGLSLLLATGVVVAARSAFEAAVPGFYFLVIAGIISWIGVFFIQFRSFALNVTRIVSKQGRILRASTFSQQNVLLFFCVLIIGLSVFWSVLMSVIVVPDDWDAWAIWGAKAKVLALGAGPLSDVIPFGHGDYPLLWPSIWAFSGFCSGGWEELWSRGWGSVFFALCLWEIAIVIYRETNNNALALMGAALFASVPMAPLVTSWSYAEAPLWLLSISCFGVLLQWRRDGGISYLIIAALLAVAAAYTKNDGMLFVALMSLWLLMQQRGHCLKGFLVFCSVFIVFYLPWLYWIKWSLHLHSHATQGLALTADTLHHIWQRFPAAAGKILSMWLDIKQWSVVLWGSAVAWLFFFWNSKDKVSMLVPVCMILGFLTIILFHHDDVYWLIGTAWNRLTLQALPLLITVLCIEFARYGMGRKIFEKT